MGKQIKKEYMGKILSNGKIPRLVVAELEENMYQFVEKMGMGFIFENVEVKAPTKKISKKKKTTKKCSHKYSRAMNQPIPRLCVDCGEEEPIKE